MRNHPDDLLPDNHFLGRELACELLQQQQLLWLRIQVKTALREMVDLRLAIHLHREEGVGITRQCLP